MRHRTNIFAYPTESFYALGADATDSKAIRQLFRVKHRQKGKPVALIAGDLGQVKKFFYVTPLVLKLARKYWPGGLTLLLRPKSRIAADVLFQTTPAGHATGHPSLVRRGSKRIGVRIPAHAQARALALRLGVPITATSANISGQPPTKSTAKVKKDFPGILIMPGRCGKLRLPSTVATVEAGHVRVLRPGAIKFS